MPYAPYKAGPVSTAVAFLVAVIAVVTGIVMMAHHKDGRGAVFIAAGVVAAVIAVLARYQRPRGIPEQAPGAHARRRRR